MEKDHSVSPPNLGKRHGAIKHFDGTFLARHHFSDREPASFSVECRRTVTRKTARITDTSIVSELSVKKLGIVLLEDCTPGRRRQVLGRMQLLNERIDIRGHHQQVSDKPGAGIAIGVRCSTGHKHGRSRARLDHILPHSHVQRAFEHIPGFVVVVNVKRRDPARWTRRTAGMMPSTASVHLKRLKAQQLVKVFAKGRHRYYSLNGADVAVALEALGVLAGSRKRVVPNTPQYLRFARTCYDHIAGTLGVLLYDRFNALRWLTKTRHGGHAYELTPQGIKAFQALGIDIDEARAAPSLCFRVPRLE